MEATQTKVKHTQGEWTFYQEYQGEHIVSVTSGSKIIADIMGESSEDAEVTKEEAKANAKLIAASPKLYDKLKELYHMTYYTLMDSEAASNGRRIAKEIESLFKEIEG